MTLAEIHAAIPHRAPFLLVDEIVERTRERILCRKTFRDDEWFFAGHYPDFPLVPGVISLSGPIVKPKLSLENQTATQLPAPSVAI